MRLRTLIAVVCLSFTMVGFGLASYAATPSAPQKSPLQGIESSATTPSTEPKVSDDDINRFTNTIVLIKDFYVKQTGDKSLLDDAIRGMVSGLDPHSEYLDPESYKALLMTTSGEFGGVGIEVTPEFGILKIVTPMDDTPASKAGIKPGDYIVAIDGKLVSEMTLQEAVDKMRGKAGSPVALTILRKGEKTPLTFKLNRQTIRIASVKSKMLDNNFGYVRITQFQEPTAKLVRDAILNLKKQNNGRLDGLVLDLRNNPGGLLESAVQVADTFLNSKKANKFNDVIVYTEGRLPEAQYSAKASGSDMLNGAPMVILVNGGSASASEIVAGALQDYGRALIIGTTSFGKGSVQTVIPLDKTHALKLTTALYHTPSGKIIQNIGIIPDVQVDDLQVIKNGKTEEDVTMLEPIKEYQLKNHLPGSDDSKNKNPIMQNDLGLANTDFQLYQAIKILRTMYMMDNSVAKQ